MDREPPSKKQKTKGTLPAGQSPAPLISLQRDITPPPGKDGSSVAAGIPLIRNFHRVNVIIEESNIEDEEEEPNFINGCQTGHVDRIGSNSGGKDEELNLRSATPAKGLRLISSPFQLNRIKDLPGCANVDTTSVDDLLGDPLIKECWQFNFLFDLDFVMWVHILKVVLDATEY